MPTSKSLTWIILIFWFFASTSWYMCNIREACDIIPVLPTTTTPKTFSNPLVITDGSSLNITSEGNFLSARNSEKINTSYVKTSLDSLFNYLKNNPNKSIIVTGTSVNNETNSTSFSSLGEARAAEVRNILIKKGIPNTSIQIVGETTENEFIYNDSISGSVNFAFKEVSKSATDKGLASNQIFESIFKPMDLYFPTASKFYIKTTENQKFIEQAKQYLLNNDTKKLLVVGHTDDEDSDEWNLKLSHQRAYSVKQQLVSSGIEASRILTDGKGKYQPKASNATAEGRRANRRVTIVVQ